MNLSQIGLEIWIKSHFAIKSQKLSRFVYCTQQHVCQRYKSVVALFDRTQNWTLEYLNFGYFLLEHRIKSGEFNAAYSCINLRDEGTTDRVPEGHEYWI